MDRGAWWATVHGVTRIGHDWASKPPLDNSVEINIQWFHELKEMKKNNIFISKNKGFIF